MSFSRLVIGALERRNPLPPGRYWVDVFEPAQPAFWAWLETHREALRVVSTSSHPADGGGPARDWVLFEVTAPVPWEGPGLPSLAGPEIRTSDDTVQKPPPEKDFADQLSDMVTEASGIKRAVMISLVIAGGFIAISLSRGGRR